MPHVPHRLLRIALFSTFVLTAAGCDMGLQDSGPDEPGNTNTGSSSPYQVEPQTVALWRFSERIATGLIPDLGPHKLHLSSTQPIPLESSPLDSAAVFDGTGNLYTAPYNEKFNLGLTGQITYEARIFMTEYPEVTNFNGHGTLIGMYAGPALLISADGGISIKAQNTKGATTYWTGPVKSQPGVVPLNTWVSVAVSIDAKASPKQIYAYVDGVPVQLYSTQIVDDFRIYTLSAFGIGNDTRDPQPFKGKIEEARVSNALVLGTGLPIAPPLQALITPFPFPTPVPPGMIKYWLAQRPFVPFFMQEKETPDAHPWSRLR